MAPCVSSGYSKYCECEWCENSISCRLKNWWGNARDEVKRERLKHQPKLHYWRMAFQNRSRALHPYICYHIQIQAYAVSARVQLWNYKPITTEGISYVLNKFNVRSKSGPYLRIGQHGPWPEVANFGGRQVFSVIYFPPPPYSSSGNFRNVLCSSMRIWVCPGESVQFFKKQN